VRVTVQLIDAASDAHLWAENYDRELSAANIFAIQSEVAGAIAGALKATLSGDEKVRVDAVPTQNLEAWEAYQLGKQRMAQRENHPANPDVTACNNPHRERSLPLSSATYASFQPYWSGS
jgi:hypothetical protein